MSSLAAARADNFYFPKVRALQLHQRELAALPNSSGPSVTYLWDSSWLACCGKHDGVAACLFIHPAGF
jgi:hypothetical protein